MHGMGVRMDTPNEFIGRASQRKIASDMTANERCMFNLSWIRSCNGLI
jgi:hypothetical protein